MVTDHLTTENDGPDWMNALALIYDGFYQAAEKDELKTLFMIMHTLHGCAHYFKHKKAMRLLKQCNRIVDGKFMKKGTK